jgi:hypothetical protein
VNLTLKIITYEKLEKKYTSLNFLNKNDIFVIYFLRSCSVIHSIRIDLNTMFEAILNSWTGHAVLYV